MFVVNPQKLKLSTIMWGDVLRQPIRRNSQCGPVCYRHLPVTHSTQVANILGSQTKVKTLAVLAILIAASTASAQTAGTEDFSFKGNFPGGMTLEEFKVSNPTTRCYTSSQVKAPVIVLAVAVECRKSRAFSWLKRSKRWIRYHAL